MYVGIVLHTSLGYLTRLTALRGVIPDKYSVRGVVEEVKRTESQAGLVRQLTNEYLLDMGNTRRKKSEAYHK